MACLIRLLNDAGTQIRNIRLANNGRTLEVFNISDGSVVCSQSIDTTSYVGVWITGADEIEIGSALNKNSLHEFSAGASIGVAKKNSVWVIGVDDLVVMLQVNGSDGLNIRYSATSGKILVRV